MTTLLAPTAGQTITDHPDTGAPCRIDLNEHMHLPSVDGEVGAVTVLLGLDGKDHDEVRLAVGDGRLGREVLDQAINALVACRAALDSTEVGR